MSAYIQSLYAQVAQTPPAPALTLRDRFLTWYNALPEVARHRAFAMAEFEQVLGTQGKYISAVLLELGWQRARKWESKRHYCRYWVPPT